MITFFDSVLQDILSNCFQSSSNPLPLLFWSSSNPLPILFNSPQSTSIHFDIVQYSVLFNPLQSSSILFNFLRSSSVCYSQSQFTSTVSILFNPLITYTCNTLHVMPLSFSYLCCVCIVLWCCAPPLLSYFPSPSPSLSHCFCRVVLLPATLSNIIRYERYVWWMSKQVRDRERRATYFIIRCNFWVFSVGEH